MIKNVVSSLGGVGVYGVLSICFFFVVFLSALGLALLHRDRFLNHMSELPLADESHPTGSVDSLGGLPHE